VKRIFSILFAVVLVVSLGLVTATPVGAQGGADRVTAITNAADRLVALQSTETLGLLDSPDYGWDWIVTGLTEHSASPSGANLYGVTALGLIDAYEETGDTAYFTAAEKTADHLKTLSRATDSTVRIQSFDYRFLVEFSALSEDDSYEAHAVSEWDWVKTNVVYYYADGKQENIYNFYYTHAGHGFAAWQAGDAGLAALAMGDTSWASNMAIVLAGHLDEITDTDIYRFIGWGHALEFLNAVDSVAYSTQITSLISNLTDSQNADGSWPGTAAQGTVQNTAYAVMGLAAVGEGDTMAKARKGANWLVTNQISTGGSIGGWIETDSQEYSENDSEALQALASVPARGPAEKATGSFGFHAYGNDYWVEFNAHEAKDGRPAKGTYYTYTNNVKGWEAEIECVNVDGSYAYFAGPVVGASKWAYIVVYDGGTPGRKGDLNWSYFKDETTARNWVAAGHIEPWSPMPYVVNSGNLVVHTYSHR
jgi:hypothetical protein